MDNIKSQSIQSLLAIKPYEDKHCLQVINVYYQAIQKLGGVYYSQTMLNRWSESAKDVGYWQKRLALIKPTLAFIDKQLVGFIELEENGHIGCLYTHPDWARRGVATCLYQHLEREAKSRGLTQLFVETSYLSRPLFLKMGFNEEREIKMNLGIPGLTSFLMRKYF